MGSYYRRVGGKICAYPLPVTIELLHEITTN